MNRFLSFLAGAGLALLIANPATAGPVITITDGANDLVTISAAGFLSFTGAVTNAPEGQSDKSGRIFSFSGQFNWTGATKPTNIGTQTRYLIEPTDQTKISDFLTWSIAYFPTGTADFLGSFGSDDPQGPGYIRELGPNENLQSLLANGIAFIETGLAQELGSTDINKVSILVTSDVEGVPEPGSLTLLGIGMLGLAGYSRRRRKIAHAA